MNSKSLFIQEVSNRIISNWASLKSRLVRLVLAQLPHLQMTVITIQQLCKLWHCSISVRLIQVLGSQSSAARFRCQVEALLTILHQIQWWAHLSNLATSAWSSSDKGEVGVLRIITIKCRITRVGLMMNMTVMLSTVKNIRSNRCSKIWWTQELNK